MSFENYKNLWVLIETEENTAKNVGYELLTPGRQLADKLGEELVAVVIGADVEAAAKKFGFETLRNEHPERGQSETIRLGTAALSDCDALCFMVADQPMLKRKTVAQELEFFRAHSKNIVGLGHNGVRGTPCLFPARFFPELLSLEGDVGGSAVIKNHLDELLLFESPEAELRDVDTKAALAAIREQ